MGIIRKLAYFGVPLFLSIILIACSSSGNDSGNEGVDDDATTVEASGIFIGAKAVEGLSYKTATHEGSTDVNGTFQYQEGESIEFSLGNMVLGEVTAAQTITASDLTGSGLLLKDVQLSNILRILQTLDTDCNYNNGLKLPTITSTLPATVPSTVLGLKANTALSAVLLSSSCATTWVNSFVAESIYQSAMQSIAEQDLAKIALVILEGESDPSIIVDDSGNSVTFLAGQAGSDESQRLIIKNADGGSVALILDANGFPKYVLAEDGAVIYFNDFTETSVDIIVSNAGNTSLEAYRIDLPAGGRTAFEIITGKITTSLAARLNIYKQISSASVASMVLDIFIARAQAEDSVQVASDSIDAGVTALHLINTVIDVALVNNSASAVSFYTSFRSDFIENTLWNAAMNHSALNSESQRIINITKSTLACVATASISGCADSFYNSASALLALGGVLYDIQQDSVRLDNMKSQLEIMAEQFNNRVPSVQLTSPVDGQVYYFGDNIVFRGSASDPENVDAPMLSWSSDVYVDALGAGEVLPIDDLDVGVHFISLIAIDSLGKTRTQTISIEIVNNKKPDVNITFPNNGETFPEGELITFLGQASDPEEGTLTGTQLAWTTSINSRNLGDGNSALVNDLLGPSITAANSGTIGQIITLTAMDSTGLANDDSIVVKISPAGNTAPEASFTLSSLTGEVETTFSADASGSSDQQDSLADLQFRWQWDGGSAPDWSGIAFTSIRTGSRIYNTAGDYSIWLQVKDTAGATGLYSQTVTVNNVATNDDFTKLSASGQSLPYAATEWSCVRDNATGYVWEKKIQDGGIHDRSLTYLWGGVGADNSGDIFADDWDVLVNGSNSESLCGSTAWRVPTIDELLTIVAANPGPHGYFLAITADLEYWSSTASADVVWEAMAVSNNSKVALSRHRNGFREVRLMHE